MSLSKQEVQDFIEFSEGLYLAENYGYFNPWLSNQIMQNINNNPRIPSFESIQKSLSNYKESEKDLQSYTEFMNNFDMIFKRTLYSYVNILAFDLQITCKNAFTREDYNSEAYLKDKKRVFDFLDKFDYKKEFKEVALELMLHETDFVWFRKTKWKNKGMKFALQTMPQDYCLITGRWEKGLLWDFDYSYFLEPGVDIMGYDPSVIEMINKIFIDPKHPINYRPTVPLNKRTGQFAYWGQTSPDEGAWCFKLNLNNANSTPFLAPFLKDSIKNDEVAQLQYNKDIMSAYAILAGEMRLFDQAKSGTKANQFAIDPKTLSVYLSAAKVGLGKLIKVAAMPTENTKFYQFSDPNKDMYDNQLSTSAGVGSGISRVIYSSDRMSNAEVEAGLIDQYETMKPLYYQFSNFLDFFVNKLTRKYKFSFIFDGCSHPFERRERFERLTKLADKGIVLNPSAWASAIGMRPQIFERSLEESVYSGWIGKLSTLMLNTNTTAQDSGRPQKINKSESAENNDDSEGEL